MELYTIKEAEEMLKVTKRCIYNYIKAGELEAVKIGKQWRIPADNLNKFLKTGTSKGYYTNLKAKEQETQNH